ncbi:MAG: hypothetical protein PHN32_01510 [Actinomycetota bacterium]|nr:hypothetical protein [Actinomycetota bacterium]
MAEGGLFITLYDNDSLELYLQKNLYSFLMKPQFGIPSAHSRHFHALADYSCIREGTHIFFFSKRRIIYGGQAIGHQSLGSFYLNGTHSPLGREAKAELFWDESSRYEPTSHKGIFLVEEIEKCQPYVLIFKDYLELKRKMICTDELYFIIGKLGFPLPSNSIQNMGFCTMTPGETVVLMNLLRQSKEIFISNKDFSGITIGENKTLFNKNLGIKDLAYDYKKGSILNEAHLEASLLANPGLFKNELLRPEKKDVICRQVPISPFKSYQMDRSDICYYRHDNPIKEGTLPNIIIELKNKIAGIDSIIQTQKYLRWIKQILDNSFVKIDIKAFIFAPSFSLTSVKRATSEFKDRIYLVSFSGDILSLDDLI